MDKDGEKSCAVQSVFPYRINKTFACATSMCWAVGCNLFLNKIFLLIRYNDTQFFSVYELCPYNMVVLNQGFSDASRSTETYQGVGRTVNSYTHMQNSYSLSNPIPRDPLNNKY